MSTLAAGASASITLAAGQRLIVQPGGQGTATLGPGLGAGQTFGVGRDLKAIGDYPGARTVYLSCASGTLAYDVTSGTVGAPVAPFTGAAIALTARDVDLGVVYVSAPLTLTAASAATRGASALLTLVADGSNAPTLVGMSAHTSDSGYVNTLGVVNTLLLWCDGLKTYYTWSQDSALSPVAMPSVAVPLVRLLNLNAAGTALIESGDGTAGYNYGGTAGQGFGAQAANNANLLLSASAAGSLRAAVSYTPSASRTGMLLLSASNTVTAYAGSLYAMDATTTFRALVNGSVVASTGTPASGNQFRINVSGSGGAGVVTFDYSTDGGSSWITIYTASSQTRQTLYPGITLADSAQLSAIRGAGMTSALATAVTLSGPSSGTVGAASSNFTVGADGAIGGTLVVTPSAGGGGGTFSPTSLSLTSGSPTGTFTYTPTSAGAKTISVTNGSGLTNPSSLTYTASASASAAIIRLADLSPGGTAITESGDGTAGWNYTGQSSGSFGSQIGRNANVSLASTVAGDYRATVNYAPTVNRTGMLLLSATNSVGGYGSSVYGMDATTGFRALVNGSIVATVGTPASGNLMRIAVSGSGSSGVATFDYSTDGGSTWTTIYTASSQTRQVLYPAVTLNTDARLDNLRGTGMA